MMGSMPYTNHIHFENWNADQVAEWLRGLDDAILPYVHFFLNNGIDGKKLLLLTHSDLEKLNITKLGHQELILEAVDLLQTLRYGYETENLQYLALQLGCKARSLHNEIQASSKENDRNKANTLQTPFEGIYDLCLLRNTIIKTGLELVTIAQKESNVHDLEDSIMKNSTKLADICDGLVINNTDALHLQPASLEIATIRKKQGEELGMHIQSAYYGVHVIGGVKDMSPAELCGKIEKGDEVIQVNYQTVIGWQLKKLVNTLKEKPKEVILLLKKRPHHISPYGPLTNKKKRLKPGQNIATLPKTLKKRRSREGGDPAKQPRPSLQEFVSSANTDDLFSPKEESRTSDEKDDGNDTDNDVFRSGSESPQYTLPVVVDPKQRRATVSGGSPTLSRPLLVIEDLDTPTRPNLYYSCSKFFFEKNLYSVMMGNTYNIKKIEETADLGKVGDSSNQTASQKRQEFTVKKPTPIVQEPTVSESLHLQDNSEGLQLTNNFYDKKPFDLLEVPSLFQNPNRQNQSKEESEEKGESTEFLSSPSSTDTLTDLTPKNEDAKGANMLTNGNSAVKPEAKDTESLSDSDVFIDDKSDSTKHNNNVSKNSNVDRNKLETEPVKSASSDVTEVPGEVKISHIPKTAPKDIDATFVDYQKETKTLLNSDVAFNAKEKNQPQLVKIRKLESMKAVDLSPSVVRRRNKTPKKVDRRVSCKDLGKGDCEGWLYKDKGKGRKHWLKRWCVLKNFNLFYFLHKEDLKAEGVIHLPAFQSKNFKKITKMIFANMASVIIIMKSHFEFELSFLKTSKFHWLKNDYFLAHKLFMVCMVVGFLIHLLNMLVFSAFTDDYYSESDDDDDVSPKHSIPSSPEKSIKGSSDDLTKMYQAIQKENLTFDGKDREKQRRSRITSISETERKEATEEEEKAVKVTVLQRTLKAREHELQEIEQLLASKVTHSKLMEFKQRHMQQKLDSDSENENNS
ncbi:hypothetical protein KUTeg_007786 [Tegillarca granosa]|uniref:Connector enhancer of kinase suppressor of ras 2 n=1 Tax=Tegillarca granosa TaxID=220873 RepID=A0ABQ9FE99_TEGGR|nr:hypothetical protein KUTeg_007786 [Tegillarca granosa]